MNPKCKGQAANCQLTELKCKNQQLTQEVIFLREIVVTNLLRIEQCITHQEKNKGKSIMLYSKTS